MCEHEKSTLLHLVQSLAYHTRLMSAEKAHRGMPELNNFILTRTETMGSLKTRQVG